MAETKIKIIFFFVFVFNAGFAYAQKATVNATITPSEIQIGEQALITLDIKVPKGKTIKTPDYEFTEYLIPGIEVLSKLKADTTISQELMTIKQEYIVTSFDSALYNIPYMYIIEGEDTIKSRNLGLKVISPTLSDTTLNYLQKLKAGETDSINFTELQIRDIKDIEKVPFVLSDFLKDLIYKNLLLLGALIIFLILLIAAIIFFIFYYRKKKKGYYFKPEIILPPHVIAIQALDKLKSEKIYRRGMDKEFYTQLTDTLRTYIEKRYFIPAMEQTSAETIDSIFNFAEDEKVIEDIRQILSLSDLVKFAKYKPLENENEQTLLYAYDFINRTKQEDLPENTEAGINGTNNHTAPKND